MVAAIVSIVISIVSLAVSAMTAWWTVFRQGRLSSTKPSVVFFGFDSSPKITAKVFIRCLLYGTAARGRIVESMFARLRRNGLEQTFNFWGYGETTKLTVGSGLFVGQTGFAANHHFVLSVHEASYEFLPGEYVLDVLARQAGQARPTKLLSIALTLDVALADALGKRDGILFELNPDGNSYSGFVQSHRPEIIFLDK